MRSIGILGMLAGLFFAGTATSAEAQLRVCNESGKTRAVAIGLKGSDGWQSEGWWIIKADQCKSVIKAKLKNRYYYIRAKTGDDVITSGKYPFCTQSEPFTIPGQDDCKKRGYKKAYFQAIDIGKAGQSFTYVLAKPAAAAEPEETASPDIFGTLSSNLKPGELGEPFTMRGIFQGCQNDESGYACAFHADGAKLFAYEGQGTPKSFLNELWGLPAGSILELQGDMISFGDITAEVALRKIAGSAPKGPERFIEPMQGTWQSVTDPNEIIVFDGAEQSYVSEGEVIGQAFLRWSDACEGRQLDQVIIATNPENREGSICHAIVSVTADMLVMSYIGGNGTFKEYKRMK